MPFFPPARDALKTKEGSLVDTPFAQLLLGILMEQRTVVLDLRKRQLKKSISFEDGVPIGCQTNLLHETLGQSLVDRKRITEDQCHDALSMSVRIGLPLGEVLVRKGMLQPFDLYQAMRQSTARKILDCFTWSDAEYRLHGAPEEEQTPLRMNTGQLVLTAATTVLPVSSVMKDMTLDPSRVLGRSATESIDESALKLGGKDLRFLRALEQDQTVDRLLQKTGLEGEEVWRRLYGFGALGMATYADEAQVHQILTPTPEAPAEAPAPALDPEERDRIVNDTMEVFLKHRKQDAFDLLGVETSASSRDIRDAFLEFTERFHPGRFTGQLEPVQDKAESIFLAGARAFGDLSDLERKNLLAERKMRQLKEQGRKRTGGEDAFKIETKLLDARQQFQDAMTAFQKQDFGLATQLLEYTCDIDPGKADHWAHLGWARFKFEPVRQDKAFEALGEALKRDPGCALAWFYEGSIREESNDLSGAEAAYRRAVKADPTEKNYMACLRRVGRAQKNG